MSPQQLQPADQPELQIHQWFAKNRNANHTDLQCIILMTWICIFNLKQSHYRPGLAHRVPGGWGSQISRQSAHEGGKVISPTHRPPYPPGNSWYSFLLGAESTPGSPCGWKDYVNEKFPMTPSGTEPATFQLVLQCLNQLHRCVPKHSL